MFFFAEVDLNIEKSDCNQLFKAQCSLDAVSRSESHCLRQSFYSLKAGFGSDLSCLNLCPHHSNPFKKRGK